MRIRGYYNNWTLNKYKKSFKNEGLVRESENQKNSQRVRGPTGAGREVQQTKFNCLPSGTAKGAFMESSFPIVSVRK